MAILKNMNENILQKSKEFDYAFISRLLLDVFDDASLVSSNPLDPIKLKFIQGLIFL